MGTFTLEQIISRTTDLPVLPAAALAVIQETGKAEASAFTVAQQIVRDAALAAKVLRLANSAFYGLSRKVNTAQEAVTILGLRTVRNLALVASTYTWLSKPIKGYVLGPDEMWSHAIATGAAAQVLANHTRKAEGDVAFCAGLMHDLGKLALSIWLEGRLPMVVQLATANGQTFDAVERQMLGYDHAEVGGALLKSWGLPEEFSVAAHFHHQPDKATACQEVVDCVHLGNVLAMSMGVGLGGDGMIYEMSNNSLERLGIGMEELDQLTDKFLVAFEKYGVLFKDLAA